MVDSPWRDKGFALHSNMVYSYNYIRFSNGIRISPFINCTSVLS